MSAMTTSGPYQVVRVARGADDVESAFLEDVHDPFPDEGLILAHDDANPLWLAHVATLFPPRMRCQRAGHDRDTAPSREHAVQGTPSRRHERIKGCPG
jgi:hypothetical protein